MAAHPIVMPKLGLTMTEGLLAEWRVAPGERVSAGDVLFAVETDKITSEVEARAGGVIEEIRVPVGETVAVGTVVATWTGPATEEEEEDVRSSPPSASLTPQSTPVSIQISSMPVRDDGARIVASPYARRMAREAGIGLDGISGSGPGGRIKAADVQASLGQAMPRTVDNTIMPYSAMIDADMAPLLDLHTRLEAEVEGAPSWNELVERALVMVACRLNVTVELLDISASGVAWLIPPLRSGQAAVVGLGALSPSQMVCLTLTGDPAQLPAEEGASLLGELARLLANPFKILV